LKQTKKIRLILLSSVIATVLIGSAFAVGLIRAKVPGDPKSFVVDICGPPPSSGGPGGGSTSGLLACPTVQGAVAWGVDCIPGSCQFGPGTTTSVLSVYLTFTWMNCCLVNTSPTIILNGITLSPVSQSGASFTQVVTSFTIRIFSCVGTCADTWYGSSTSAVTPLGSGVLLPYTSPSGVSNSGNILQYYNAQGIQGIRAVIAV